ncbi:methenyltetrahydrofolate synthetase [Arctopsyche grandis]|uniref:methenyltetrahydrofolate synthetase n=1 Tax=Arctopsyche grandis TaxID=121162 RepID=UPI00406D72B8
MSESVEKMNAIKAAKSALRKSMTSTKNNMSLAECKQQSDIVQQKILKMREWSEARRISIYLSMDKEVSTNALAEAALQDGKECFVPICTANHMRMLKVRDLQDLQTLPKNSWGIKEPKPTEGRDDALHTGGLDLVIVPGVAFTERGERLGHGKGYYDRFLEALKELPCKSPAKTVALAFNQQIVKSLPISQHDVKIHQVVFPLSVQAK